MELNDSGSGWHRFRKHATWMRRLFLREEDDRWMKDDVFDRLLAGSQVGLVCPALCLFTCYFTRANQRFIPHFLSPHLTHFAIRVRPSYRNIPRDLLPNPTHILQVLPTSCLQEISIDLDPNGLYRLEDEVASMIQRFGQALRVLRVPVPLGEAAVHHVVGFKNLRVWTNVCDPPPSTLPLSTNFPPLRTLTLRKDAYGWIPWLAQRERAISDVQGGPVGNVGLKATLTHLRFREWAPVDPAFISLLSLFQNLAILFVQSNCAGPVGCAFSLTNQDLAQLSAALPRLEVLELGRPCPTNTSLTTVPCLLALSVHCKSLSSLCIHLNTTDLIGDIQSLSEDPGLRDLGSLPTRCRLVTFKAGRLPFPHLTSDEDITTIAAGLVGIFPSLINVSFFGSGWVPLLSRVRELQGVPELASP